MVCNCTWGQRSTGVAASCCGGAFLQEGSALHKTDGIMRVEKYIEKHLKTSVRKWKLGHKWVFQMDNDTKHTSKVVGKWLKDNKVKVLEWPSQSPHLNPIENAWAKLKKCVQARRPTNLTPTYTDSLRRNVPYCGKATRNVWPKLNNLNAMLRHTNWVYVNFWPTGNVMKEIKAEIKNSLYYYSDISHP